MSRYLPRISRMEYAQQLEDKLRTREPWRFSPRNQDILTVEEVAGMCYCSVDQARRIPRDRLPAKAGPGKRAIYLREDVIRYIQCLPDRGEKKLLALKAMSKRSATPSLVSTGNVFDIDAAAKRLAVRKR